MTDATWNDLAARIEAATGGDREIDAAIFRASGSPLPNSFMERGISLTWHGDGSATMPVGDMQIRFECPAYTASLDAITALIARELPGWKVGSHDPDDAAGCASAFLSERPYPEDRHCMRENAFSATEALARCAAFCRAKAVQG